MGGATHRPLEFHLIVWAIALLVVTIPTLVPATALAAEPTGGEGVVSADAERFVAPPMFAYWAGSERAPSGELALAAPRPFAGDGLAPARDEHRSTTAFLEGFYARTDRGEDPRGFSLTSLHDLPGGATGGANFYVDSRDRTAIGGLAKATIPLPGRARFYVVPTLGVGAGGDFDPLLRTSVELWTDRRKWVGATMLAEVTRWSHDRTRAIGELASLARLGRRVALEQRLALGAWLGPGAGGETALRSTSAALQELGRGFGLYERVTLTRGLAPAASSAVPVEGAFATDLTIGARRAFGGYGVVLQAFEGGEAKTYRRWGMDLMLYRTLF